MEERWKGAKKIKGTLRNNKYDSKHFTKGDFIMFGQDPLIYSLNKKNRWQEIEDAKNKAINHSLSDGEDEIPITIREVKNYDKGTVKEASRKSRGVTEDSSFTKFLSGRQYSREIIFGDATKVSQTGNQLDEESDLNIIHVCRAFAPGEYPLNRETHWNNSDPCPCCFYSMGRISEKKGMGDKARKKTKGMKKARDLIERRSSL